MKVTAKQKSMSNVLARSKTIKNVSSNRLRLYQNIYEVMNRCEEWQNYVKYLKYSKLMVTASSALWSFQRKRVLEYREMFGHKRHQSGLSGLKVGEEMRQTMRALLIYFSIHLWIHVRIINDQIGGKYINTVPLECRKADR